MRTIRAFEDHLHAAFGPDAIPGAVHLYAGQEAVAAGVCAELEPDDSISSTHRGHGHAIAKGCDLTGMMLEIYGRAGGLCHGKGGSMHIADVTKGMLGANGIAGGGVPMTCGAALSAKVRGTRGVAVAFVGDGGANQGAFLESLNLAAVWELPCIFVVENNGYAQATSTNYHLRGLDVARRAEGFGISGVTVDGTDFFAVNAAAAEAVEEARSGGGPSLIECQAMRFYGHMEGWDSQRYRARDEVDRLRAQRDCLTLFADRVRETGALSDAELADIDRRTAEDVAAAAAAARTAPDPDPATLTADVYTTYGTTGH
jgi:pyruvate dehydrogenase E1 component alpha subunit